MEVGTPKDGRGEKAPNLSLQRSGTTLRQTLWKAKPRGTARFGYGQKNVL